MAKARNTAKSRGKSKPTPTTKSKTKSGGPGAGEKLKNFVTFLKSPRARKILGVVTMLFSIFLLVSIVSHFFTGNQDRSVVEVGLGGEERASNWLGFIGAVLGYQFVYTGFGVMSALIPIFTGIFGFVLLEGKHYKLVWKLLRYLLFFVIWGSCTIGFGENLIAGSIADWGGGFSKLINESWMFPLISKVGMALVLIAVAFIFVIATFNTEFKMTQTYKKVVDFIREKTGMKVSETETAEEDSSNDSSGETPPADKDKSTPDSEKEDEMDFVISVKKVPEPAKKGELTLEVAPTIAEKTTQGGSLELSLNSTIPATTPVMTLPDTAKAEKTDGLELEIELSPTDPELASSLELDGDNIIQTEEDTYEKIVPEKSQEVLEGDADVGDWEDYDPTKELSNYEYPPIDLLQKFDTAKSKEVNRAELEENKNKIVNTLQHYKIEITHIKATIGPTVTLYEIVPAPGVRISKIRNLEDDIALSLAALGIRIIAPIPGKGTIGIEIPNSDPEIVSMRSTLATEKFKNTEKELPLALGRTISNEVYIADLTKMPHLLIAGATGQGKSVGINGLISSILYKKHPSQVKFVLIDPKKVELNLYQALENHFLAKLEAHDEAIITDTKQVIHVLNSLCLEMDNRYDLLKKAKARNLKEYNAKFLSRRLNPRKGHRFMPYIVLIVDEFADLMMTAGKEIEAPIARLAQLARAIGIHLVLATQRPSVNVITGIIKANFPARISFRVTSKVDSRTILDTGGADQLIGRGDMLLSTGSDLIRIQNAFIDTPEVEKLVDFIADQQGYPQPYFLPEVPLGDEGDMDDLDLGDERDEMFEEAARVIVRHQQGSTSLIQRKLKLGYNRAGRIVDQLEYNGIVGPFSGSKARDVLVKTEMELEQILSKLS